MEDVIRGALHPSRRRSRGFVTQNACTECRRRRAKCDGQKPCEGCTARKLTECMYEVPAKLSKESMRAKIEQLQGRLYVRETVIEALALDESSGPVLQQLKDKVPVDEIADQVYKSFPSLRRRPPPPPREGALSSGTDYGSSEAPASHRWDSTPHGLGSTMEARQGHDYIIHSQESIEEHRFEQAMQGVAAQWTKVSSDKSLIEHLLALYFCWEHPIFQTVSREHFLADLRIGNRRYCSHLLVNAMLALGCRFSAQQDGKPDPDVERRVASQFFAEAKRLVAEKKMPSLPAVQALGLMSLYEASCGRDGESWYFSCQSVQMAIEMGLHTEIPIHDQLTAVEREVRTVTFWGAFVLHQAWSLALGRLPNISKDMVRVAKCPFIESTENDAWAPYRGEGGLKKRVFEKPSNIGTIYRYLCELSEIIHGSLYVLHTPGGGLSSTDILEIYTHYLAWYRSLPELCHVDANSIPAVLQLHMYYHFALIMLFRPFIKLRFLASAVSPLAVCAQAADHISSLVKSYRQAYSLRQTPAFLPYILLASAIAQLVTFRSVPRPFGGPSLTLPELADLQTLSACYPFARCAISIVQFLARQWGTDVFIAEGVDQNKGQDELCLPNPGTMNFFCPNLEVAGSSSQEWIDTALFRPFPMQGLPLLAGSLAGMERI